MLIPFFSVGTSSLCSPSDVVYCGEENRKRLSRDVGRQRAPHSLWAALCLPLQRGVHLLPERRGALPTKPTYRPGRLFPDQGGGGLVQRHGGLA